MEKENWKCNCEKGFNGTYCNQKICETYDKCQNAGIF